MVRAATLLLVLTLVGTPVASMVCMSFCGPAADVPAEACHDHGAATGELALSASHDCGVALDSTVVLPRAPRAPHPAVTPVAAFDVVPRLVFLRGDRLDGCAHTPPSSSHPRSVVLRI